MGAKKYSSLQNKLRRRYGKSVMYKKSLTHFLLRQIKTDLTYARLKSLLPQQDKKQEEVSNDFISPKSDCFRKDMEDNKQIQKNICMEPVKSADSLSSMENCPMVIMEQHELNLFIRVLASRKCSGAQSELYQVLEEHGLDILHAQGYSTKDRLFHSILVKMVAPSQLDLNLLSERLYRWAGKDRNAGLPS